MLPDYVKEIDLIALVSSDLGAGIDTGKKWRKFLCPFCRHLQRELKTFLLVTNEGDRGFYICKFCQRKGDAMQWLKDYRKLSHNAALDYLRGPYVKQRSTTRAAVPTA